MVLSIYKTQGHSMEPIIKNGSFFVSSSVPYVLSDPKIGDAIVFRNQGKVIVKKVKKVKDNKYFIEGINKRDSKSFSPLKREEVLGKVIWIF